MPRKWNLAQPVESSAALRHAVGGHPLVARLLAQRGYADPKRAEAFLDPNAYVPASPFGLPGMVTAIDLLRDAIARGASIRIWGDFDADGQTATAVLYETLSAAGARVDYDLPRRGEGHGLVMRAIDDALAARIDTLITCDTGIGDGEAIARAVQSGMTVIVTDHHDLSDPLPPAHAIVDPKMLASDHPLHELAGVGVAYMVSRALLDMTVEGDTLTQMLDLVALGLVADMATQINDVRYLVQCGLGVLQEGRRPGLAEMARNAGLVPAQIDEHDLSFQLGPRLNAVGRLGDARMGVELLTIADRAAATELAGRLEALNHDRQARTEAVYSSACDHLTRDPELLRQPAIILSHDHWEPGVLGQVAGHLANERNRPAILIATLADGTGIASARSVQGVDIHAAIASQRSLLLREGGHPMAAGFAIESRNIPAFTRGINAWLREHAAPRQGSAPIEIDARIPWQEISRPLARQVRRLAPHGEGNPVPIFITGPAELVRAQDISQRRTTPHRRLHLVDGAGRSHRFTWFNAGELPPIGERVEIAFHLSLGHWHGQERLELNIVDIRLAAEADPVASQLVAGREVIDWRWARDAARPLAEVLAQRKGHEPDLAVWAEGISLQEWGKEVWCDWGQVATRHSLRDTRPAWLAILTPPPSPEALERVLSETKVHTVYLLPPQMPRPLMPNDFVAQVAGMAAVAIKRYGGVLDTLRMAAHIAARERAVVLALRLLDNMGRIALCETERGLVAEAVGLDAPEPAPEGAAGRVAEQERLWEALRYQLRETRAYREAYATLDVRALFAGLPPPARH